MFQVKLTDYFGKSHDFTISGHKMSDQLCLCQHQGRLFQIDSEQHPEHTNVKYLAFLTYDIKLRDEKIQLDMELTAYVGQRLSHTSTLFYVTYNKSVSSQFVRYGCSPYGDEYLDNDLCPEETASILNLAEKLEVFYSTKG